MAGRAVWALSDLTGKRSFAKASCVSAPQLDWDSQLTKGCHWRWGSTSQVMSRSGVSSSRGRIYPSNGVLWHSAARGSLGSGCRDVPVSGAGCGCCCMAKLELSHAVHLSQLTEFRSATHGCLGCSAVALLLSHAAFIIPYTLIHFTFFILGKKKNRGTNPKLKLVV